MLVGSLIELVKKPGGLSAEVHTRIVYILQVDQIGQ